MDSSAAACRPWHQAQPRNHASLPGTCMRLHCLVHACSSPFCAALQIHTSKMTANSFLGRDVDLAELAARTKNFSGAEIEGLVKSATSFALNRQVGGAAAGAPGAQAGSSSLSCPGLGPCATACFHAPC